MPDPMSVPALRRLETSLFPDRARLVWCVRTTGSAVLQGWSDRRSWTVLLPWPEEIRAVPWSEHRRWKDLVAGLELPEPVEDIVPELPFLGGWVGFLAYETGAIDEGGAMPSVVPPEPPAWFALHRSGVLISDQEAWLFAPPEVAESRRLDLEILLAGADGDDSPPRSGMVADSLRGTAWTTAVEAVRESIAAGDVYQVNLTRRLETAPCRPAALYRALTGSEPPRCSALLNGDGWSIVSASPEVFLQFDRRSGVAESRPIKGTVRREGEDDREIAWLTGSGKDAAEHLMIVDLVRNDLGRVAPPGGVSVAASRTVRTLAAVHHLESTIRAEGLQDVALVDLLSALFPAGSITGAPKRAAVGMIDRLEPVPRGVYTGAIGFHDFRGRTELSVAIRTAVVTSRSTRYHAGGGIVWESDPDLEDQECRAKADAFLRYFGGGGG